MTRVAFSISSPPEGNSVKCNYTTCIFLMAAPMAYGNFWVRAWIPAAAAATLDPLTYCARLGIPYLFNPLCLCWESQPKPVLPSGISYSISRNDDDTYVKFFSLLLKINAGAPIVAQRVANPTSIREEAGSIPGLAQRVKDLALPWAVV